MLISAAALGLAACDQKTKETAAPESTPAPVAESTAPGEVPVPPVEKAEVTDLSAEQRAGKLGFVQYMPQDTEQILAFYNGSESAAKLKNSKLWQMIQRESGLGGMGGAEIAPAPDQEMDDEEMDPTDAEQETVAPEEMPAADPADAGIAGIPDADAVPGDDMDAQGPAALFEKEFTIALGKDTSLQIGNLLTVNRRMTYFQMRNLSRAFAAAAKSGDSSTIAESFTGGYGPEIAQDLLKDPDSGVALLERLKMPPVYFAFRATPETKASAAMQMAAMVENVNMMGNGMAEPVKIEAGGSTFEGAKIIGAKISAQMAEGRASMDEEIGAETTDRLLATIATKDLIVVSGTIGDYIVLFLGGAEEDLRFAEGLDSSLVASEALAFSDAYSDKQLAALSYTRKEAVESIAKNSGGLADVTNGLRDGIAGADGLGDTRDLDALFQMVAEREAGLRKLATFGSSGMVAFFEEGLQIEGYSGSDAGMIDWESPNKLASLGDSPDVLLFADVTGDAAYGLKAREYAEAVLQSAYALSMKVSQTPAAESEMAQFKEMATMFDTKFRADVVALWDAYSDDFQGGLGTERAFVIDLQGSAPAVPGIPQVVVDKAKVPRISMIAPVTDRAKVSASWDKMDTTLKGTLAKISEMTGQDIPMQKPLSSEKDGKITWFFPMPFLTEDFLPSVTVSDKWFVASTSKNQALDLMNQANTGNSDRKGFYMSVNFKALQKYADQTFQLVNENSAELMGGPMPAEQQRLIKEGIAVLDDVDNLTIQTRKEGAVVRTSIHFKTR